MNTMMR